MGTRGMIQVFDSSNKLLVNIYVHSDMYPDNGMMCEVAKFLRKRFFVNGIDDDFKDVNGMDNLAALITAHLIRWRTNRIIRLRRLTNVKDDLAVGFVYLLPFDANIENADVEYAYELRPMIDEDALHKAVVSNKKPKVLDVIRITAKKWDGKAIDFFDGTLREFAKQYCKF